MQEDSGDSAPVVFGQLRVPYDHSVLRAARP